MNNTVSVKHPSKLISIITVCLNSAKSIGITIDSILSQGREELEYIIIDGDSKDGTQDIIKSFGEGIDILVSEPDEGISDAFNKGIFLSSGKIIGIINSGDVLLPGTIDRVVSFFAENPRIEVVHGDVLLYENDTVIKRIKPAARWWLPWRLVLFNHPSTFVRREVYERYGAFSKNYRIAMDVEVYLRWVRSSINIRYLPEALVGMSAGGVSGRHARLGYSEVRRAFIEKGFPKIVIDVLYMAKLIAHAASVIEFRCRRWKARLKGNMRSISQSLQDKQ